MTEFKVKTRGNASPSGKSRVYFTCHPDDFDKYFAKITDDVLAASDCAIYYTDDMTAQIEEKYLETDLGRSNVYIVPITFRLLTTPNRAMDFDIAYAFEKNIPILPFMMENSIEYFYEQKFGKRQFLCPYSHDLTEISYEEKLKKRLDALLVSEELANRIRDAFDAYVFLSYRKKDRHLANELMKMIHSNPKYRDIAIWFDEFITPGEDFHTNITDALRKSEVFALMVTPNLLEEGNFVMCEEYPLARDSGKSILPAEMKETDRGELEAKYEGIPPCINPVTNETGFDARLMADLEKFIKLENDTDPEHLFLMGMAYLEGIDVETNHTYGLELITKSAEMEYPEAMEKLYKLYNEGEIVACDFKQAKHWAQKLYDYYLQMHGKKDKNTLTWLNNLALAYGKIGDFEKSLELDKKAYALSCKVLGDEHPDTLISLNNLALAYGDIGDYEKSLELNKKAYALQCKVLGDEHPDTLTSLINLAVAYDKIGDFEKSLELNKKAYALRCKVLGDEHPDTLISLNNLAVAYYEIGDFEKSLELNKKAYALQCKVLGDEHPDTISSLNNLALAYGDIGDYEKKLELDKKAYALRCKVLGDEHPDTLISLNNLASAYGDIGDYEKKSELNKKAYALQCKVLGDEHPDTISLLNNLAVAYYEIGDFEKSLELTKKAYALRCKVLGDEHPDTLISLSNLAYIYGDIGDYEKKLELDKKAYALRCKVLGDEHPDTISSLNNLASAYDEIGDFEKSLELNKKVYALRHKVLGDEHPDTLISLNNLAFAYGDIGDYEKN